MGNVRLGTALGYSDLVAKHDLSNFKQYLDLQWSTRGIFRVVTPLYKGIDLIGFHWLNV